MNKWFPMLALWILIIGSVLPAPMTFSAAQPPHVETFQNSSFEIAFISESNLWLMQLDGSNLRQLTTDGGYDEPDFSPDGSAIAFTRAIEVEPGKLARQIGWIDLETEEIQILVEPVRPPFPLFNDYYQYSNPKWSPDGGWIYFLANDGRASGDSIRKVRLSNGQWDVPPDQIRSGRFGPFDINPDGVRIGYTAWTASNYIVATTTNPNSIGQVLVQGIEYYGDICWLNGDELVFVATPPGATETSIARINSSSGDRSTLISEAGIRGIDCSTNGQSVVYEADGELKFLDIDTGSAIMIGPGSSPSIGPATFEPVTADGMIAFLGVDFNIWIIGADGSNPTQITTDAGSIRGSNNQLSSSISYRRYLWSPDGSMLAMEKHSFVNGDPPEQSASIWVYDLITESSEQILELEDLGGIAWSPDSSTIAYALPITWGDATPQEPIYGIWQVEIATGETSELVAPQGGRPLYRPDWSPDGRYLAFEEVQYIEGHGDLAVFDFEKGVYIPWNRVAGEFDWFPDGDRLVFDQIGYAVGDTNQLVAADVNGQNQTPFTPLVPGHAQESPLVSPTGDRVAYFDYRTGQDGPDLWIVDENGENPFQPIHDQSIRFIDWSPDGNFLVISGDGYQNSVITVLDINTGARQPIATGAGPLWQPVSQPIVTPTPTPPLDPGEACGTWQWEEIFPDGDDPRIEIRHIPQDHQYDCREVFEFNNETPKFLGGAEFGGYSLELEAQGANTLLLEWKPSSPVGVAHTYLLPSLDVDLHVDPLDPLSPGQVNISGDYSLDAMGIDAAFFLIRSALTVASPPGPACVVQEDEIAIAALRTGTLLTSGIQLALRGDLLGARAEINRVLPEFYESSAEAMEAASVVCAGDILVIVAETPGLIAKIAVDYFAWLFSYFIDYGFNHGWRPVDIRMYYSPSN